MFQQQKIGEILKSFTLQSGMNGFNFPTNQQQAASFSTNQQPTNFQQWQSAQQYTSVMQRALQNMYQHNSHFNQQLNCHQQLNKELNCHKQLNNGHQESSNITNNNNNLSNLELIRENHFKLQQALQQRNPLNRRNERKYQLEARHCCDANETSREGSA